MIDLQSSDALLHAENRKATKSSLRERNQRLVLQQVLSGSAASRADIARNTGLTRASVSGLVSDLIDMGLLREVGLGAAASKGGKPPTLLEVDAEARQIVCVDASADPISAGVVTLAGEIVARSEVSAHGLVGDDVVDALRELVAEMRARTPGSVLAVAVGTPGVVQRNAVVLQAANFGWINRDLAAELASGRADEVLVLNDAQAAALAEYSMAPEPGASIASVLVGAGIGSGVVLNGRLYRGESSSAGEIGHLDVGSDKKCSCGKRGCLETVASLPALLGTDGYEELHRAQSDEDVDRAFAAVGDGVWAEAARGMGAALAAVVAILDVKDIVLGGTVTSAGQPYLERVQAELDARLLPGSGLEPTVRYSELNEDSVLLGVASYALHQRLGVGWTSNGTSQRPATRRAADNWLWQTN